MFWRIGFLNSIVWTATIFNGLVFDHFEIEKYHGTLIHPSLLLDRIMLKIEQKSITYETYSLHQVVNL